MKPYSIDETWELLAIEHHARGAHMPWLDRQWYRAALAWLRWRLRRIARGGPRTHSTQQKEIL